MKRKFIISKLIEHHAGSFYLVQTATNSLWTSDIFSATAFSNETTAEKTLKTLPEGTVGNFFKIEELFVKYNT